MRYLSNVLFFIAGGLLLLSVVLLDISLRHMKKGEKLKSNIRWKLGLKFLLAAGVFFTLSYLVALLSK